MSNEQQAYDFFVNQGFTPAQAAGIVGNLVQESGVNPESVQQNGPGRGIAQWSLGGRWIPSLATGNVNKDLAAQEQYIIDELQSNPAYGLSALRQATTPTQAAQVFGSDYERYGVAGARLQDAVNVYNDAQDNNWPVASNGSVSSGGGPDAVLTGSTGGSVFSGIMGALFPGWGIAGGVSDIGKIADDLAAGLGFAAQKQPQTLQGNSFLGSVDELLNPSVTLLNPWKGLTMIMARGGIALLGVGMLVAGVAILALGTSGGRQLIGDTVKAAAL